MVNKDQHRLKAVVSTPDGGFTPVCWCGWTPKQDGQVIGFKERWRAEMLHGAHALGHPKWAATDPEPEPDQPLTVELRRLDRPS